jgi:DNA-binding NtrC family response regulator
MSPGARTVLVVDDDRAWRGVLEHWLKAEGIRAISVTSGEWVVHAIRTHEPDVVLLDLYLPGQDGLGVLDTIRRRWPALPVVIMTAFGGPETQARARGAGATGYLDKPFRMASLTTELARVAGEQGVKERPETRDGESDP